MNHELIYDNQYHGIPLCSDQSPFLASRFDDALATIESAMTESTRLVMSCYKLYLPANMPFYVSLFTHTCGKCGLLERILAEKLSVIPNIIRSEATKHYFLNSTGLHEMASCSTHSNFCGFVFGKSINTSADTRKCN